MLTPYEPVTPLRPPDYGGTGPSPALALLVWCPGSSRAIESAEAQGYDCGAPPWIWRRGADNGAHCTSSTVL